MSILPARVNHTIWKGADFQKTIIVLQGGQGSAPRDLTGWSAVLNIRDRTTGTILMSLNSGGGGIVLGTIDGTVTIIIPDETTSTLTWKIADYELLLTGPVQGTNPYMTGQFNVTGL